MSVILVVERDASHAERIKAALRRDGLSVFIAASRAEALRIAEERAPSLLLASSAVPEAAALLADFSRQRGGPGAIVMVEDRGASPADYQADTLLAEPFTDDDLGVLVRRCLKLTADSQPEPTDSSEAEQLTSADIFGDVLAEVEAEARGTKATTAARKPMEDIERRLEETLSGVLPVAGSSKRPNAGRGRKRQVLPTANEIDDLLNQTLSSLDIPTRSKKPPASAADAPAMNRPPDESFPSGAAASEAPSAATAPAPEPESTGRTPRAPGPRAEPEPRPTDPEESTRTAGRAITSEGTGASGAAPSDGTDSETAEPGFTPPAPSPGDSFTPAESALAAGSASNVLDDLQPEADQFRTQALPTLDLATEISGADAEAPSGEAFGDYTLMDRIAIGGMAEVWRARRRGVEGFQKTVAIKKILSHLTGSQDFVTMFIDEAKLAAQLSHNNITQIYDLGKVGNDFFIAMEHVDGKDLRSILTAAQETRRPIPLGLGLLIVSAVARALDYAHRKRDFDNRALGLVHRDVSPQNVMISYEGAIKLCDFGIVKAVAKASTTQMGALKGKLQYMSPEQAWGKSVDARSDIFSLGSVLYEVLTGSQLFSGESEIGVLDAVRECRISSPRELVPDIPEEVAGIVLKALAKSPDDRFQTAGDLEHDLRAVLDNLRPTQSQKDLATYMCSLFETTKSGAIALAALGTPAAESSTPAPASPSFVPQVAEQLGSERSDDAGLSDEPPAAVAQDAGTPSGRWKWLAAAVLVTVLAAIGFLTLPSLLRQEASTPAGATAPGVEDAAPLPAPSVTPAPLEDAAAAALDDPTSDTDIAGTDATAAPPAAAGVPAGDAAIPAESGSGVTAAGIDIEQMVNEELTSRADQLRRDFEAEKKRIEEELARTQEQDRQAAEDDKDGGAGGDG